ncbi:Site-specific recombinase, phage integrase family, partial [Pseudomonas coronafaciens pv. zizaniae]
MTESFESDCRIANDENDMQELTKNHTNDQRRLTAVEFQTLAKVPAAVEWFANLDNPRTRRAYQNDLEDFCSFIGLASADEFRVVTRSHVLA